MSISLCLFPHWWHWIYISNICSPHFDLWRRNIFNSLFTSCIFQLDCLAYLSIYCSELSIYTYKTWILSVCLCVHVFLSLQKSQLHESLAQCVIWILGHACAAIYYVVTCASHALRRAIRSVTCALRSSRRGPSTHGLSISNVFSRVIFGI